MLNTVKFRSLALAALTCVALTSCSDKDEVELTYPVPEAYSFENVNYSGQSTRLAMLDELDAYVKTGNNGTVLSAQKMRDMYANENNPFANASLNEATTKELKNKTVLTAQTLFENIFDAAAAASQTAGAPATDGTAGILTSNDNTKRYLVDENGLELAQVIQKGLMGAVFYNQAVESYLSEEKIGPSVDNTNVTPGKGTTMEHHWDEAFGYFGAPTDFPANKTGIKYWANYSNKVDNVLGSNKAIMDAFIKGRAAISAKDMKGKDEAAATVRNEWERLVAASAIHELNVAKNNTADQALKSHYLSEAIGFIMGLQYKTDRKLTAAKYEEVMNAIGTNLHLTSATDINEAIDILSNAYGMDSIKGQL